MRKLIVLSLSTVALIMPSISSALDVYGKIHPERYTFFLNTDGGNGLKDINNKIVSTMMGKIGPGNMQDALIINNIQKEGYDSLGIAPFAPESIQKSTVRDDDQPVKAVTCLMSTVTVPNSTRTVTMDRTWCKDEVGAEYIGFNGWPLRSAIAKTCRVGDNDCPVYLSLQGDDPTVRNDSVRFKPSQTSKVDTSKIGEIKTNGCVLANESVRLQTKTPGQCKTITKVDAPQPGSHPYKFVAHFQTDADGVGIVEVTYDTPNLRMIQAKPVGAFYYQSFKEGKWVCTGAYGACY